MKTATQPRTTTYLVFRKGGGPEEVVLWDTIEITVGRHDSQDIVVDDSEISRKHAVFRHKEDRYTIEDQGTPLGTLVNGEPIRLHELEPGDTIEIGPLQMRFGQTTETIRPGGNVRFASELKGFALPAPAGAAAGRTMMAFDAEDSFLSASAPTLFEQVSRVRAVSADGTLEELDAVDLAQSEGFDLGAPEGGSLDEELARHFEMAQGLSGPRAPSAGTTVQLVVEVMGPASEIEAFVAALRGKCITIPPLTLLVRTPS